MRMIAPLDEILGRRSKVVILRYLLHSRREATGRDLARSVGLDHKTCREALRDLVRNDVVHRRGVGKAWLYALNADGLLVKEVLAPIFSWERALPERLASDLRRAFGPEALSIFMFGSTARGTDKAESDVDLLVVARSESAIGILKERAVDAWERLRPYARPPQPVFMDVEEFTRKYRENHYFLAEIVRSGRHLHGLRIQEILDYGRTKSRRSKGGRR